MTTDSEPYDSGPRFDGRVVVVTGAARGQGQAEAKAFARLGAAVLMVDVAPDLEDVAGRITEAAGDVVALRCDVAEPAGWDGLVREARRRWGRIDVLVNNAAILPPGGVSTVDAAAWARCLGVNVIGPALGISAVTPLMHEQGGGCVVNVGSVAAFGGYWSAAYSVSKWGLRGLTQVAAAELGRHGIRTVAVHPGIVETDMSGVSGAVDAFAGMTPLGRAATVDDIANVVLFLASDRAAYINGADIVVDGGLLAAGSFTEIRRRMLRPSE